ncbi:hypothetical protein D3875_03595 [Deinococcus cavernae]|uniref:Uncharacterized protein n=1 Tax=Deinococcus cavernae TaxID=2320857 RepID=A0A418VEW9_9DEIO|nr:hypothetical protein [Deinococcus cavernae]RJF74637.1 hypothetical protein D3875_03595 [Deinococcus cavernae]
MIHTEHHPAELDPRVKAANSKAAARTLAEAAAALEVIEANLRDLDQPPPSAAERAERHALHEARRAGLEDLHEYPADVDGHPCRILLDGPCVSLLSD